MFEGDLELVGDGLGVDRGGAPLEKAVLEGG